MEKEELYELLKKLPEEEINIIKKHIENGNYKVALEKIKEWNENNKQKPNKKSFIKNEEQENEKFPKKISNIELEKAYIRTIAI